MRRLGRVFSDVDNRSISTNQTIRKQDLTYDFEDIQWLKSLGETCDGHKKIVDRRTDTLCKQYTDGLGRTYLYKDVRDMLGRERNRQPRISGQLWYMELDTRRIHMRRVHHIERRDRKEYVAEELRDFSQWKEC